MADFQSSSQTFHIKRSLTKLATPVNWLFLLATDGQIREASLYHM
jgi:hypothetical protein